MQGNIFGDAGFAATTDDFGFMLWSDLSLSLVCDLSGEGPLLFCCEKDKQTGEGVLPSSSV